MNRPPQPTQAIPGSRCPTCGALVPPSCHDGCPELERRRREAARVERDRARLFGIERPGVLTQRDADALREYHRRAGVVRDGGAP